MPVVEKIEIEDGMTICMSRFSRGAKYVIYERGACMRHCEREESVAS